MEKSKWPPIIQNGRQKNANHIFSLDYHIIFLKSIILKNVPKNSTKQHKGIYKANTNIYILLLIMSRGPEYFHNYGKIDR